MRKEEVLSLLEEEIIKEEQNITSVKIPIDIGRTARSSSYFFERLLLNIWKYRNIWKLPYHIF